MKNSEKFNSWYPTLKYRRILSSSVLKSLFPRDVVWCCTMYANSSLEGIGMETTFGERSLPSTAVDVPGNSLAGSSPSGSFLLFLSVWTVRLWHSPQLVWKGRLATGILHWHALCFGVPVWALVLGLVGFSLSDIYLVFMHLFFLSQYLAFLMCKNMEIVKFSHCKIVSKQTNSRVILVHPCFSLT